MGCGAETLIDLTYAAALEPALWKGVLEGLADQVGGTAGWLSQLSVVDNEGAREDDPQFGRDLQWAKAYIDYFGARNPLHRVADPSAYQRAWRPAILTTEDWIPTEELCRTEYYNDYWRPQDVGSALMLRLALCGPVAAVINILKPHRGDPFGPREVEALAPFHADLIRAFDLTRRLGPARQRARGMEQILDGLESGVFLLDAQARVLQLNRGGERIVEAGEVLCTSKGRLCAVDPGQTRRLQDLIARAACRDADHRRGGAMSLTSADRRHPVSVTVAPLRAEAGQALEGPPMVLVCASDLDRAAAVPTERLQNLFGLTPAEARLAAALAEGDSPGRAAERFGLSGHTVHNQLVRIFDKTGVRRQSELLALMTRAAGQPLD